jgi:hypothetical protein
MKIVGRWLAVYFGRSNDWVSLRQINPAFWKLKLSRGIAIAGFDGTAIFVRKKPTKSSDGHV